MLHAIVSWYERLYIAKEFINKYKISDKVTDKLSEVWYNATSSLKTVISGGQDYDENVILYVYKYQHRRKGENNS